MSASDGLLAPETIPSPDVRGRVMRLAALLSLSGAGYRCCRTISLFQN
jgi:hypothetical protein